MDSSKIVVIQEWSQPSNIKKLYTFLDLTSYYQCFILNYGCNV
ncbi:unnamed protein product [Spirodela intermedia]|uniref:Uncharacterized protein n=2 Tax=Spirodela intermedia TaxID=51605 RepID=A0A7I8K8C4_SPIIN|nr:unnamed protein product [Spirodela intermedia]CAA6657379.1 unnamed protein product [Spirodela intermedia]CAA7393431.1 unnamed protein product [Spirodela intermedia]